MSSLPSDYLERVYAGVLGKIIGVLLGRPFEMWSHQRIVDELGEIRYYVNTELDVPLVVIDDDISGTFTFIRALEEHAQDLRDGRPLTAEQVGKTWLNNIIEKKCIFWWGGNGISTEHTAFRNLKHGIAAPASGSAKTNGRTVAEQIGAQIFIDGWAMVAPGKPELASQLAEAAARVSHDGEAVYAAKLWAAMEAEAFISKDINHLLDTGLRHIPQQSQIAHLIADIRAWCRTDMDWKKTRQKIEDEYGPHKYHGVCHVMPNHGIMIMALIYGGHSFHEAMYIINTCGWDTDCNSGNVGCLVAIMHGLAAFEGGPDWRGPIADRVVISSADGGYSINTAANIALDLANMGHKLAGASSIDTPKNGAQYHFSLPGSVQGFQAAASGLTSNHVHFKQEHGIPLGPSMAIDLQRSWEDVEILTDTFMPKEILDHKRDYELVASPLLYPGQLIEARFASSPSNTGMITTSIRLKAYNPGDALETFDSKPTTFKPGERQILKWRVPANLENRPICKLGIVLSSVSDSSTVYLESIKYSGTPHTTFKRPQVGPDEISGVVNMWHRSFVSNVDTFHTWGPSFFLGQNQGEGIVSTGTRQWQDYSVTASKLVINLGGPCGVAFRIRGLRRWYAMLFVPGGKIALVKARDEKRTTLVSKNFQWSIDEEYEVKVEASGNTLRAQVGDISLDAEDDEYAGGGIGLIVMDGSLSCDSLAVFPIDSPS